MSKIALSPNISGTGTLTISAPDTSTDRTIDLPDAAGTVFVSGQAVTATTGNFSGNVTLGSSVLATPTGSAPSFTCRAWCNFDGTGTPAIRASGNVSSITDNGTGNYTVNFTTAMPDAQYASSCYYNYGGSGAFSISNINTVSSSSLQLNVWNSSGAGTDSDQVHVAIFR